MNRNVCVHRVPEIQTSILPDFVVFARTDTRQQLLQAITAADVPLVLIDIDEPDALATIVNVLEVRPGIGVVGVTATADLNRAIAAQRAGCKQITTHPLDPHDLNVALRRALSQKVDDAGARKTIAVVGATGGAGATTIACHLAVELARLGHGRCALLDLDFEFGGVARGFDVTPKFSVSDLAEAGTVDSLILSKTVCELPVHVDVIARPPTIRQAHLIDEAAVRSILRFVSRTYPFVVLDLPRKLDGVSGAAIEQCDKLLVITQLTVPSVDNARRLIEALTTEGVPHEKLELVVNRSRKSVHTCTVAMAEQQLGQKVFANVPSDFAAVHKALDAGHTLAQKNPVRTAITEMAAKLAGPSAPQPSSKGWFANLVKAKRPTETAR